MARIVLAMSKDLQRTAYRLDERVPVLWVVSGNLDDLSPIAGLYKPTVACSSIEDGGEHRRLSYKGRTIEIELVE